MASEAKVIVTASAPTTTPAESLKNPNSIFYANLESGQGQAAVTVALAEVVGEFNEEFSKFQEAQSSIMTQGLQAGIEASESALGSSIYNAASDGLEMGAGFGEMGGKASGLSKSDEMNTLEGRIKDTDAELDTTEARLAGRDEASIATTASGARPDPARTTLSPEERSRLETERSSIMRRKSDLEKQLRQKEKEHDFASERKGKALSTGFKLGKIATGVGGGSESGAMKKDEASAQALNMMGNMLNGTQQQNYNTASGLSQAIAGIYDSSVKAAGG